MISKRQQPIELEPPSEADNYLVACAEGMLTAISAMAQHSSEDAVASEIGLQTAKLLNANAAIVFKRKLGKGRYEPWARYGLPARSGAATSQTLANSMPALAVTANTEEAPDHAAFRVVSPRQIPDAGTLSADFHRGLIFPLNFQREELGQVLVLVNSAERVFNDAEIKIAQVLLSHAAVAIQHTRSLEEAHRKATELETLRKATLNLTASLDLEKVLNAILESALQLLDGTMDAHIFLYDGRRLEFGAAMWADGKRGKVWSQPRRDGLTFKVAEGGEMILVPDMNNHPLYKNAPSEWTGAIIGMPLKMNESVIGVMNVAYAEPREFSERDLGVLQLMADQAAIVIENARLHKISQHQAFTDSLTSLPNRRAFDARLSEEIQRSNRYGHSFTLVLMDLDGFKRVNDSYGHVAGDNSLRAVADCLRLNLRATDFLARYGGDEFVLILPETDFSDWDLIAEKLKRAVTECPMEWQLSSSRDKLTLSLGVAGYPHDASDAKKLLELADESLYGVKGN